VGHKRGVQIAWEMQSQYNICLNIMYHNVASKGSAVARRCFPSILLVSKIFCIKIPIERL
jgi:hypothetical protein